MSYQDFASDLEMIPYVYSKFILCFFHRKND